MRKILMTAVAVLAVAAMSQAAMVMTAGSATVAQNAPAAIDITVTGGDQIMGLNLFIQSAGPLVTGIDLTGAGKLFAGNNVGVTSFVPLPSAVAGWSTMTATGLIAASGTVASVSFDTTGLAAGQYLISLTIIDPENGDMPSDFAGTPAELVNGMITVTPEPAALALLGLGGLFIRRRHA